MVNFEKYRKNRETAGPAAPWYGQYGGGMQYVLPDTIANLSSLHPFS